MIANHQASKMSNNDMLVISYVPQGGNWKNIPTTVPSKRLQSIRESYAQGKGSRSTYYGRLREDMPSHTISTYFTRPGNGCNIHYSQNRTITYREAARLQSFPDSFIFLGSNSSICKQIGNAVPPILSYQIASALPIRGAFVDLFCGAGGLALGFYWAGWTPIIANDIEESFVNTHHANIPGETVVGDIATAEVTERIVNAVKKFRRDNPSTPLFVLGGPPCQGFSTANYRTTADARNWLFKEYSRILSLIRPDGFVFENVTGILNFEHGEFFPRIVEELKENVESVTIKKINSANYAVPQRRERVIIIGGTDSLVANVELNPITRIRVITKSVSRITNENVDASFPLVPTVKEALDDLPEVFQGEDASNLDYRFPSATSYQRFMRGEISVRDYIDSFHKDSSVQSLE